MKEKSLFELEFSELLTTGQIQLLKIAIILAVALVGFWIVKTLIRKVTTKVPQRRLKTVLLLLNSLAGFVISVLTALIILTEFGIDITPILASAGIAGLAIGFGAQTLVRDLISGFFLLAEDQIRISDLVKIGEFEGEVEKTGLRTITLRDYSGNLVLIPNSEIHQVINLTRDWAQVDLKIGVLTKYQVDQVLENLEKVCQNFANNKEVSEQLLSAPKILGIEEISGNKMILRIVFKTKPKKQFDLARKFNYLVKKAFEEKGLEFA